MSFALIEWFVLSLATVTTKVCCSSEETSPASASVLAIVVCFNSTANRCMAITIHGGSEVGLDPQRPGFRVPKRDLVSAVQVLLQNERLKIPRNLPLAEVLKRELLNFRQKIDPKTAHDSYSHWREGEHDDLVLASAMGCWYRQWWNSKVDAGFANRQAS